MTSDTILHIVHNHSGEEWTQPIKSSWCIDLRTRILYFLRTEFSGELRLDGELSQLDGEYTATIYTDGRQPGCGICWESAGFYTVAAYGA